MHPVPIEVREIIVAAKKRGERVQSISLWTGVSVSTIWNICKRAREDKTAPTPFPGRRSILTEEQLAEIKRTILGNNDITLEELIEQLNLPIKKSRLSVVLIRMGFSFKKRLYTRKTSNAKTLS